MIAIYMRVITRICDSFSLKALKLKTELKTKLKTKFHLQLFLDKKIISELKSIKKNVRKLKRNCFCDEIYEISSNYEIK